MTARKRFLRRPGASVLLARRRCPEGQTEPSGTQPFDNALWACRCFCSVVATPVPAVQCAWAAVAAVLSPLNNFVLCVVSIF